MYPPRWRHLASLLGAVSVVGLGWWLYPTDARRIRAACEDLAVRISVPPGEPDMARVARLAQLAQQLAPDIIVEAEGLDARIEGKNEVMALVGRLAASPLGVAVTLDEAEISIGEDREAAEARVLATAREPDPRGGPEIVEQRRLALRWVKHPEGWRLTHVMLQAVGIEP